MAIYDDFVAGFTAWMAGLGYTPNEPIIADDKKRRVAVNGERKLNTRYQLRIDGDFAVGWVHNFVEGKTHKWHSGKTEGLSDGEREALNARIEATRVQKAAEVEKLQARAANKAAEIWAASGAIDVEHSYIVKKQIEPMGARQQGKHIIVPVYADGRLVNRQRIAPDGSKRFLTGGRLVGAYACIVFKQDAQDKIIICEGWATGCSLRMATGLPIIVAFNAGNLMPVAATIAKKYPDAEIIIAADNDDFTFKNGKKPEGVDLATVADNDPRWVQWRNQGILNNVGWLKACAAARAHDCLVAVPEFIEYSEAVKPTDFNDLHVLESLEAVRCKVQQAAKPPAQGVGGNFGGDPAFVEQATPPALPDDVPPEEAYADILSREYSEDTRQQVALYTTEEDRHKLEAPDGHWREMLIKKLDSSGKPTDQLNPTSITNVSLIIENNPRYADLFCYDEFAHEKIMVNCPPWENPSKFQVRAIADEDITRLAVDLEYKFGLRPQDARLKNVFNSVVMKKRRNPAQEYFNTLVWDGTPRLDTWLQYYCGAETDEPEYLRLVGRKWLTAGVKRVMEAGCKFDHMLILEGTQGTAKSYALEKLATIHGRKYFDDTIKVTDLGNDKTVPKLQGVLIIELAELTGFRKKDSSELKQAITVTRDRIIKKYANEATHYPRQFILAGTINPMDGYLQDPTGDRRFWPVDCGNNVVDWRSIERDRDQLWAEAVHLYKQGEPIYVLDEEKPYFVEAQLRRRAVDPWQPLIEDVVKFKPFIRHCDMDEVWRACGVDKMRRDAQTNQRISGVLTSLGFVWQRRMVNGERFFAWFNTAHEQVEEIEL